MNVTPTIVDAIARRLRDTSKRKINQSDIARATGMGRAWASRLMLGKLKTLKDEHADILESLLDIQFYENGSMGARIPEPAARAAKLMQESPAFRDAFLALVDLGESIKIVHSPRYVPTQDMNALGRKIAKLAKDCEGKDGKLANAVLSLLSDK